MTGVPEVHGNASPSFWIGDPVGPRGALGLQAHALGTDRHLRGAVGGRLALAGDEVELAERHLAAARFQFMDEFVIHRGDL